MDDANRPKAAPQSRADELRERDETDDAWQRYYIALRVSEKEAFIDAVLGSTMPQEQRAATQQWRDLFLVEEALKAGPMCEALAVIKNVSSQRAA